MSRSAWWFFAVRAGRPFPAEETSRRKRAGRAEKKVSFNSETDGLFGISSMGKASLDLLKGTAEAAEGTEAFIEKRPPDFSPCRKQFRRWLRYISSA